MMSYACRFNWFYKVLKMTKHLVIMFQIILSYEFKGTALWRDFFTAALSSNLSAKNVGGLNVVLLLSNYHLAMFVTGLSFFCIIEFFDKNVVLSITLSCSLLKFTMQFLSSNLLKSLLFLKKTFIYGFFWRHDSTKRYKTVFIGIALDYVPKWKAKSNPLISLNWKWLE